MDGKVTIVGYASCPYFQMAKRKAEELEAKNAIEDLEIIVQPPQEFRRWVRENSLAKQKGHTSSPACYVGDYSVESATRTDFLIGGNDRFQVFARKLTKTKGGGCTIQ